MSDKYVMESLLRPAVELYSAAAAGSATFICLTAPWAVALAPSVSWVTAAGFGVLALKRTSEGMKILRYRQNIRRLPRYVLTSEPAALVPWQGLPVVSPPYAASSGSEASGV